MQIGYGKVLAYIQSAMAIPIAYEDPDTLLPESFCIIAEFFLSVMGFLVVIADLIRNPDFFAIDSESSSE